MGVQQDSVLMDLQPDSLLTSFPTVFSLVGFQQDPLLMEV
jgi:hypothetical protein